MKQGQNRGDSEWHRRDALGGCRPGEGPQGVLRAQMPPVTAAEGLEMGRRRASVSRALTSPWTRRSVALASGHTPGRDGGVWVRLEAGGRVVSLRAGPTLRSAGAILLVSVPATIITSDWRGLARKTTPKRSMS